MELPNRKWTMVVDMDKCTGCQACVVACHAENNVPIHTEGQVAMRRAMHWIHIERYWANQYPNNRAVFIPLMCQQCTNAPCEPVCPVYATHHSERENMNLQVYNRCVGTRYCQNNDPYKVRFFNFYDPPFTEIEYNQLNPDVTVRSAGIMEKCTFCVQRIRRKEEEALVQGRQLQNGEMVPACVQTCPPGALIFGDLYLPNNPVEQFVSDARKFILLEQLGTIPQVIYLKGGKSNVSA
jgi:Fe-S-cluster-containing dehydrogenase component